MASFTCDIVSPDARLFSGEAGFVVVPGAVGEMGFLKGHVPVVSVLADGEMRICEDVGDSNPQRFIIQGGYVQVAGDRIIILADRAVNASDIDVNAVRDELASIEARIAEMSEEELRLTTLVADKAWCDLRLKAAQAA